MVDDRHLAQWNTASSKQLEQEGKWEKMLKIIEINTETKVENLILHERIKRAKSGISQEFIAIHNGLEAAFLSYEDWSNNSFGFIYEIYVLPDFRRKGIGKKLLIHAESIAFKLHRNGVRLKATPLDHDMDIEFLSSWYIKQGYSPSSANPREFEKFFTKTSDIT